MSPPAPVSDAGQDVQYHAVSTTSCDSYTSSITVKPTQARRSIFLTIILPTVFAFLLTAGFGTLFLVWLFAHRSEYQYSNGALLVNEGTKESNPNEAALRGLTISSITSSLVSFVNPLVMTLLAYVIALKWLSVDIVDYGSEGAPRMLPMPLQYGLMVRLLSGENLFALYDSMRYLMRSPGRRALVSPLFKISLVVALISYALSHAVGATDLWLHLTTHVSVVNATTPIASPSNYSLEFNQKFCDDWYRGARYRPSACYFSPNDDQWGSEELRATSIRIIANNSPFLATTTPADTNNTSILILTEASSTLMQFRAMTYGARAKCLYLNPICRRDAGGIRIDSCLNIGIPELPVIFKDGVPSSLILGRVGNTVIGHYQWYTGKQPTNPFPAHLDLRWPYDVLRNVRPIPDDLPNSKSMIATCNVTIFRAVLQRLLTQGSERYIIESELPTDPKLTAILMYPLFFQLATPVLTGNMYPHFAAEKNNSIIEDVLAQELARITVALTGPMHIRTPALTQAEIKTAIVGQYQVLPVLAFITSLYLYATLVLFVVVWAIVGFSSSRSKYLAPDVGPAQLRLSNPMALVATLFPPASSTKETRSEGRVGDAVALFDESGVAGKSERLYLSGRGIYGVQHLKDEEKS